MKKEPSLKDKILLELKGKYPHFISGDDIERFAQSQGKKASNGRRRVQELAAAKRIENGETPEGYVQYRYKFLATELPPSRVERPKEMSKLL